MVLNILLNIRLTLLAFPNLTLSCLGKIADSADLATATTPLLPLSWWNNSDKKAIPSGNDALNGSFIFTLP